MLVSLRFFPVGDISLWKYNTLDCRLCLSVWRISLKHTMISKQLCWPGFFTEQVLYRVDGVPDAAVEVLLEEQSLSGNISPSHTWETSSNSSETSGMWFTKFPTHQEPFAERGSWMNEQTQSNNIKLRQELCCYYIINFLSMFCLFNTLSKHIV